MVCRRRRIRIQSGDGAHPAVGPNVYRGRGAVGFREGLSPVARFGVALGAVLAATAIVLSAGTAYLMSRYVVMRLELHAEGRASHFGTSSGRCVPAGLRSGGVELTQFVTFHFSIYTSSRHSSRPHRQDRVSYDERSRAPDRPATIPGSIRRQGMRSSSGRGHRGPRLAVPDRRSGTALDTHHMDGMTAGQPSPGMAGSALEAWVRSSRRARSWRRRRLARHDAIDAALMRIRPSITGSSSPRRAPLAGPARCRRRQADRRAGDRLGLSSTRAHLRLHPAVARQRARCPR